MDTTDDGFSPQSEALLIFRTKMLKFCYWCVELAAKSLEATTASDKNRNNIFKNLAKKNFHLFCKRYLPHSVQKTAVINSKLPSYTCFVCIKSDISVPNKYHQEIKLSELLLDIWKSSMFSKFTLLPLSWY